MPLNILAHAKARKDEQRRANLNRALLHFEARLGGEVFGPVAADGRREFFCLDGNTWVWHEEFNDDQGTRQATTTRYDVRPQGVLKSQGNSSYQALSLDEAKNLYQAISVYEQKVTSELQRLAQAA